MDGDHIPIYDMDDTVAVRRSSSAFFAAWYVYSSRSNRSVRQLASFRLEHHAHQIGYTIQALISLGSTASKALPAHFQSSTSTSVADVVKTVSAISGIFLWLLAFWFFSLTTVAIFYGCKKMTFNLTWWAFIFPNAGFTLATIQIGNVLGSTAILWLTSVMTAVLFIGWLLLIVIHVKALYQGRIL